MLALPLGNARARISSSCDEIHSSVRERVQLGAAFSHCRGHLPFGEQLVVSRLLVMDGLTTHPYIMIGTSRYGDARGTRLARPVGYLVCGKRAT